jgi:DnaJ-class molecular chaperone
VLKVDEKASVKEIKKAYRRMAVLMHPDKLDIKTDEEKVSV